MEARNGHVGRHAGWRHMFKSTKRREGLVGVIDNDMTKRVTEPIDIKWRGDTCSNKSDSALKRKWLLNTFNYCCFLSLACSYQCASGIHAKNNHICFVVVVHCVY